jgi:hypothetical protein
MSTHRRTWQKREGAAAALFGAQRQCCSGSSGREDCSRSDSTHPTLYVETKLRQHHAAVALLDGVKVLARREGRVPVVALATKGRRGVVLVMDAEDLPIVAAEYARAQALPADAQPDPTWPPTAGRSAEAEDLDPGPPAA